MPGGPLILYIPGLYPKPEHSLHREQVLRCMLEGVRRIDADTADEMAHDEQCFDIVSWTFDFYGTHRDINLDLADIEAVLKKTEASAALQACGRRGSIAMTRCGRTICPNPTRW